MTTTLRDATTDDAALIADFVRKLADYERLLDEAVAKPADFASALAKGSISVIIAERDSMPVGFALWFKTFSTFTGKPGVYLEDLFVLPKHRKHGVGRVLLRELARRALASGCTRMEWSVLNWNTPALEFYRAIGARPLGEWTKQRLDSAALANLAE